MKTMSEEAKLKADLPERVLAGGYFELSGTSMAAPVVAATAAKAVKGSDGRQ